MSQISPHGFFYPFVFPFYQKQWLTKSWWVVIIALIPILNFAILRGWRLSLVRNMAHSTNDTSDNVLPAADVVSFFKHGCVLWFMTGFYVIIPTIIIFAKSTHFRHLFRTLPAADPIWIGRSIQLNSAENRAPNTYSQPTNDVAKEGPF